MVAACRILVMNGMGLLMAPAVVIREMVTLPIILTMSLTTEVGTVMGGLRGLARDIRMTIILILGLLRIRHPLRHIGKSKLFNKLTHLTAFATITHILPW
jgi:hypothetical protein